MSDRIKKINETIKQELGMIILREVDFPEGILVTVAKTDTTRDLQECKVLISVFPETEMDKTLKILQKHAYILHQELNKKLFIRRVPKLIFRKEKENQKELEINQLLDSLEK